MKHNKKLALDAAAEQGLPPELTEPEERPAQSTRFFDSIAEALAAAGPEGSAVLAIGFDNADFLLRAGYKLVENDPDITLVRGGEREFASARAKAAGSKLITVPTHAFAAAAAPRFRKNDKAFAVMKECAPPFAAVFSPTEIDENYASVFGEIVALDLCAFDLSFAQRMRGEPVDAQTVTEAAAIVTELTDALRGEEKDRDKAAIALVAAGKRAARLVARTPALLHCSGAAQTAEALRMLYSAEDRPLGMRGETEMILSAYITEFYIKNLIDTKLRFPPDNNKRIDSVCEYFGTDVRRACLYAAPIYPPIKMRLYEYRRDEFRAECASRLSEVKSRGAAAASVFKRLYRDDGYAARSLVDKTDLAICVALAPDVFAADSMLSFLKQTGRLEEYLI